MKHLILVTVLITVIMIMSGCEFVVNSTLDAPDSNPGDGVCDINNGDGEPVCTLRAAIMEANAYDDFNVIKLPEGTYELTIAHSNSDPENTGALFISTGLRIQGATSHRTFIEQTVYDRVLTIDAPGHVIDINNVAMSGGNSTSTNAGVLIANGEVHMHNSKITRNKGYLVGGLEVLENATAYLTRVTVSENWAQGAFGGGIRNAGSLHIKESTIDSNEANRYGGILNIGELSLIDSTVSRNYARSPTGGVGGILQRGVALIKNTTITGNRNNNDAPDAPIRGGGIQTSVGYVTVLQNSIVAQNEGSFSPDDCVGSLDTTSHYNLIGDQTGCIITRNTSTYIFDTDPEFGFSTAGFDTYTYSYDVLPSSPAVDAGTAPSTSWFASCDSYDQRGLPRLDGKCDLGSVESKGANLHIRRFVLINADSDSDIQPLMFGDTLVLDELPPSLAIRTESIVESNIGSMVFDFDGNKRYQIENSAPFSLGGDSSGDFAPVPLSPGVYSLRATPFSSSNGAGDPGYSHYIEFYIKQSSDDPDPKRG